VIHRRWILACAAVALLTCLPVADSTAGTEQEVICGDLDGDGSLNVGDLIYFDDYLWLNGPPPVDMWAANCAGCDGINIQDMMALSNRLFCGPPVYCDTTYACLVKPYGAVSVETVVPHPYPGILVTGSTVRFSLRLTNTSPDRIQAYSMGFRIYSLTGAVWGTTTAAYTDAWDGIRLDRAYACPLSVTGSGADTIGFGGYGIWTPFMDRFDSVALTIDIGPIPEESAGKTLCLDTTWYPPGGDWMWDNEGYRDDGDYYTPTWEGRHCFTIAACCEYRGDATLDGGINVSDLTYLVAYLFQGGPGPGCFEAGDVNGDTNGPNVSDLTYLVAFLFQGGPEPPGC